VPDIARFLEALFGGELVTPDSLREMTTVAFPNCHPNVGLGFKVYDQFVDARLHGPAYWAGGWGFSGWFDFYAFPRSGVIIGWGANLAAANVDGAGVFDYFDIIEDAVKAVFPGRNSGLKFRARSRTVLRLFMPGLLLEVQEAESHPRIGVLGVQLKAPTV
jgi:hypothetical protein